MWHLSSVKISRDTGYNIYFDISSLNILWYVVTYTMLIHRYIRLTTKKICNITMKSKVCRKMIFWCNILILVVQMFTIMVWPQIGITLALGKAYYKNVRYNIFSVMHLLFKLSLRNHISWKLQSTHRSPLQFILLQ